MKYKHYKMIEQYKNIAFFLFGELWKKEVKNIDKYDDMYKFAINLFKTIYQ